MDMSAPLKLVNSDDLKSEVEKLFASEKNRILSFLPYADIQHVGGTALPNSPTKGDIDIQIRVTEDKFAAAKAQLIKLYDKNVPDRWTSGWASFNKDLSAKVPIGLQLTAIGTKYDEFHKFRDFLLANPKALEAYNDFKKSFEGKTYQQYRDAKDDLFGPNGSNKLMN